MNTNLPMSFFIKDPFFDIFDDILPERFLSLDNKSHRYPLTNLGRDEKNNLVIEIAVAGFSLEELSIQTEDNVILVKGHHEDDEEKETKTKYIQEHISSTDFARKVYMIPMYVGGKISASLKNGILTILVEPVEDKKAREIKIIEGADTPDLISEISEEADDIVE